MSWRPAQTTKRNPVTKQKEQEYFVIGGCHLAMTNNLCVIYIIL